MPTEFAEWDETRIASEIDERGAFLKVSERFFIRGLLPIFLEGEHVLVAAIWVEVDSETLFAAADVWDSPDYGGLAFTGHLANDLAPWPGVLGAQIRLEVRSQSELPYVVASSCSSMSEVIDRCWPHDLVLRSWSCLTG